MKKFFDSANKLLFMVLCLFFLFVAVGGAQEVMSPGTIVDTIKGAESWTDLIGMEAGIYTVLITLGGWFSAFIPGLRSIDSGVYRVLVWAVMVVGGSLVIGIGDIWVGALSYFFSTSLYEVVIKLFIKSPKPSEVQK
jgi:hypothetical protein